MKLLHAFPPQNDAKFGEHDEEEVTQENHKIEVLGPEWAVVILFEYLVTKI